MERLTNRTHDGHAYLVNVKDDEQEVECKSENTAQCILDSWERLADYEDTGLMPEEIVALKERTRWIPVSERLPNMCGFKCLVCAKNKFEQTDVFTAFTGYMEHGKLEFHSCEHPYDDLSACEITHWMPLPEAPKEAEHADS